MCSFIPWVLFPSRLFPFAVQTLFGLMQSIFKVLILLPCFWNYIHEITAKANVVIHFPRISFLRVLLFQALCSSLESILTCLFFCFVSGVRVQFQSSVCVYSVFPVSFVEETLLASSWHPCINRRSADCRSVGLSLVSVLCIWLCISATLNCGFAMYSEIRKCDSFSFALSQDSFGYSGCFALPCNFQNFKPNIYFLSKLRNEEKSLKGKRRVVAHV